MRSSQCLPACCISRWSALKGTAASHSLTSLLQKGSPTAMIVSSAALVSQMDGQRARQLAPRHNSPSTSARFTPLVSVAMSVHLRSRSAKLVRRTRSRRCEEQTLIFPLESISLSSLSSFQFADLVQISKIIIVSTGFSRREGDACSGAHTNSTPL